MINITKNVYNSIKSHALKDKPFECCGLLIESGSYIGAYPCKNIAEDKLNHFALSPYDYLAADDAGGKIKAFYHSHCLPTQKNDFSLLDKFNSINHKLPLILYYVPKDEFKVFNDTELNYQYVGRKFEYGKFDCLSLVEDFYLKEFNVRLPEKDRYEGWEISNPSKILDNIRGFGFKEVSQKDLRYGDLITIQHEKTKLPSHLLIYLEDNQILHHRYKGYSTVENYNEIYKSKTYNVLRHKDVNSKD